jgi:hypothetical protein
MRSSIHIIANNRGSCSQASWAASPIPFQDSRYTNSRDLTRLRLIPDRPAVASASGGSRVCIRDGTEANEPLDPS